MCDKVENQGKGPSSGLIYSKRNEFSEICMPVIMNCTLILYNTDNVGCCILQL